MTESPVPKVLDAIVDKVLSYRPKPKSEAGKKRKKAAKRLASVTADPNQERKNPRPKEHAD